VIDTCAVDGDPSVALPEGLLKAMLNVLMPVKGDVVLIGTANVLLAASPAAQASVPLAAV
jgi:hypothetical protein